VQRRINSTFYGAWTRGNGHGKNTVQKFLAGLVTRRALDIRNTSGHFVTTTAHPLLVQF
jgi:hypothetical protein